ncbi:hypothetical protein [Streptomyces sp. NPDC088739]|uniref:hypothetical protein n=1 Tax=Streptomyces sp. NPDC088739 TaxID=3365882 RepID=UPI00380EFCF0
MTDPNRPNQGNDPTDPHEPWDPNEPWDPHDPAGRGRPEPNRPKIWRPADRSLPPPGRPHRPTGPGSGLPGDAVPPGGTGRPAETAFPDGPGHQTGPPRADGPARPTGGPAYPSGPVHPNSHAHNESSGRSDDPYGPPGPAFPGPPGPPGGPGGAGAPGDGPEFPAEAGRGAADPGRSLGPEDPDHLRAPTPPPHPYYQELEFLTHGEAPVRFAVRYGEDHQAPGRPGFLARRAYLGTAGQPVVQYRLASPALADPYAYGRLEREVAAAVALERRYGGARPGAVLTRTVGFDLTSAEPFVLYRPQSGRPLADWAGRLAAEEQERIIGQLATAVRLLADAGLVHRAVTPGTVRWDGTRVRLCEPYAALRAGEPREPYGAAPWASPEQRAGHGTADPRDDLWSVAEIAYFLLAGRPDRGEGPPRDLADYRRLAALEHSGVFSPRASERPGPEDLLRLLHVPDPLASGVGAADPLDRWRAAYDQQIARKRALSGAGRPDGGAASEAAAREPRPPRASLFGRIFGGADPARPAGADRRPDGDRGTGRPAHGERRFTPDARGGPAGSTGPAAFVPPPEPLSAALSRGRMCPHCLLPVTYDERLLVTIDAKGNRIPLDLGAERRPGHRADALRKAYHLCPHTGQGDEEHELPVPYLTNGEPLTVALVGSSSVGKTHLLAAMLGEVELGGLEPYGLKCRPLNPEAHRTYLRERVQSLQQGRQLGRTGQQTFARFADGLLVSAGGATPRPVVFFDLAGEDLAQDSEVGRFLMGVDAFVFVLDPLRALRLTSLDPVRQQSGLRRRELGDEAFATVLNRIPRQRGGLVAAPVALAVNKSDLVRFEPVVDRWLGRALTGRHDPVAVGAESRDAYAFLAHHASAAWLKPFDDCADCTLHFVAATGGQARGDRFPHGARPRRVLAPLLSLFASCGLLPGVDTAGPLGPGEGNVR